jgi:hypothetical protein
MTCDGDTKLVSQRSGASANRLRSKLRTENYLNNATPIPQVDKEHLTVITECIHPPGQYNNAADIGKTKTAALNTTIEHHMNISFLKTLNL